MGSQYPFRYALVKRILFSQFQRFTIVTDSTDKGEYTTSILGAPRMQWL